MKNVKATEFEAVINKMGDNYAQNNGALWSIEPTPCVKATALGSDLVPRTYADGNKSYSLAGTSKMSESLVGKSIPLNNPENVEVTEDVTLTFHVATAIRDGKNLQGKITTPKGSQKFMCAIK